MLITREADYALRMLRSLRDGEQRSVREIAETQLVPQQFAYKILKKLSSAGLVQVTRGAEGGCRISADMDRVSLYDLLRVMEADSYLNSCMNPDYACPRRDAMGGCGIHCKLAEIQNNLDRELRSHSLGSILSQEP